MEGAAADAAEAFFAAARGPKAAAVEEKKGQDEASDSKTGVADVSDSAKAEGGEAPGEPKPAMSSEVEDAAESFFAAMRANKADAKVTQREPSDGKGMSGEVADAADAFFAAMRAGKAPEASSAAPAEEETPADQSGPRKLKGFVVDSATMQGRKAKQEDKHVKVPDFAKAAKALKMPIDCFDQPCAFFAIYHGFRGSQCAEFLAKQFHTRLLKRLSANTDSAAWTDEAMSDALRGVFEELDADYMAKFRTAADGCTMVVALVLGLRLFTAWVGNCRCFVCTRDAAGWPSIASSTEDHRPVDAEADRIKEAGGVIVDMGDGVPRLAHEGFNERIRELRRAEAQGLGTIGKVPNSLAVSRAFGDREFKAVTGKALLIATPGIKCFKLEPQCKFITLECGGIADVMPDEDVMRESLVIRDRSGAAANVRAACGAVVSEAYKRGSIENLTVIVAALEWDGLNVMQSFAARGLKREEAPAPIDTAAAASKKRRLAAAAVVKEQKIAAHERAVAAAASAPAQSQPAKKVLNGGKGEKPDAAPVAESAPAKAETPAGASATAATAASHVGDGGPDGNAAAAVTDPRKRPAAEEGKAGAAAPAAVPDKASGGGSLSTPPPAAAAAAAAGTTAAQPAVAPAAAPVAAKPAETAAKPAAAKAEGKPKKSRIYI